MSTPERERVEAGVDPLPPASVALVPRGADRPHPGPVEILPAAPPRTLHRWFFGMWYVGLALIAAGAWLGAWGEEWMAFCFVPAMLCLAPGGLGILIHFVVKPSLPRFRQGLGALASLALTGLAAIPLSSMASEVRAAAAVARLQALAQEMAGFERMWTMVQAPGARLQIEQAAGYSLTYENPRAPVETAEALRRAAVAPREFDGIRRQMRAAGMGGVQVLGGALVFRYRGGAAEHLMYVRPGEVLPQNLWLYYFGPDWRSKPLGGGWYLVRRG